MVKLQRFCLRECVGTNLNGNTHVSFYTLQEHDLSVHLDQYIRFGLQKLKFYSFAQYHFRSSLSWIWRLVTFFEKYIGVD